MALKWSKTMTYSALGQMSSLRLTLLDYPAAGLCAICYRFRPFQRQWTIPAVLAISTLPSLSSATKILCQKSRMRSPVSSRELDVISHIEIARARASSREIKFLTSDTASELLSVEKEMCRCSKRPESSRGDEVAENGAIRRIG